MNLNVLRIIFGVLFLISGIFFTFKPPLTYEKEQRADIIAVIGIILMIFGITLLLSPLIK